MENEFVDFHSFFDDSVVRVRPEAIQVVSVCGQQTLDGREEGTAITVIGGRELWLRESLEEVLKLWPLKI